MKLRCSGDARAVWSPSGRGLHIATLAVDLANSAPLRGALLDGRPTEVEAEGARARRLLLASEIKYRTALPYLNGDGRRGADRDRRESLGGGLCAWGSLWRPERSWATRSFSIFVRKRGEKKLLLPREAMTFGEYALADRRVSSTPTIEGPVVRRSMPRACTRRSHSRRCAPTAGSSPPVFQNVLEFHA